MKSKSLLFLFSFSAISIFIIAFTSCKKLPSYPTQNLDFDKPLNITSAKEWYYGTFKKSPEWISSTLHGKQLPDWKHGLSGKIGNLEFVEFPLIKSTSSFSISESNSLTTSEVKKIAAGSMSKIAFIKTPDNKIEIREIDYIPDWQYLQNKHFDISDISIINAANNFTGRLIVKKWDGFILSLRIFSDGKIIKKGSIKKSISNLHTNSSLSIDSPDEDCTSTEYCVWQADCTLSIYPDGMQTDICGDWYNTGECWTETYCSGGGGDDCELYGIGCGDGEGGGSEPPNPCQSNAADAQQTLNAITGDETGAVTFSYGTETTDPNGIIREPVTASIQVYSLQFSSGLYIKYSGQGSGIRYKENPNARWKWESFIKSNNVTKDNGYPPCFSDNMQVTISDPVFSSNLESATLAINYNLTISISCLGGLQFKSFSGSHPQIIYAN